MSGSSMSGWDRREDRRAQLSAMQTKSNDFRGFSEDQLDELFPFLTFVDFEEGEEVVAAGEEASWFGLLLGGSLDVMTKSSPAPIATLHPGRIVGEMAFFRGGRRGASMIGGNPGTIAVMLFSEVSNLYKMAPSAATLMVLGLGRASVRKLELTQPPLYAESKTGPPPSGDGGGGGGAKFEKAMAALESKGLTKDEVEALCGAMRVVHFHAGQTIMRREHTLSQFGIVLQGSVEQGFTRQKRAALGDMVGEYEVLSGHPLAASVVGGPSGGAIGFLSLADLAELGGHGSTTAEPRPPLAGAGGGAAAGGCDKGQLAVKVLKLLGIAATSEGQIADDLGSMIAGTFDDKEVTVKTVETLYRHRVKKEKEKAAQAQAELDQAVHDKKNFEIMLKKLGREKAALMMQNAAVSEELKQARVEIKGLQKTAGRCRQELDP